MYNPHAVCDGGDLDCGFGTFAQRPMNSDSIAFEKLKVMSEAAKKLREMVID